MSGTGGTSLDVGDVDGDGDLDLWVGSTVPEPALYLNNGAGKFVARPGALPQACSAKHARFADVDNDGDVDMLMLCTDMLLYVNSGNGEFAKMTNWLQNEDGTSPEGGFTSLWNAEFTDVDNDNDLDILVETETGWALLLNSARGEAVEAVKLLDPGTGGSSYPIEAAAFGDVNGDGYPDILVASSMVRRARVHMRGQVGIARYRSTPGYHRPLGFRSDACRVMHAFFLQVSRPNLLYINNPKTRMFEASTDSGLTTSTQGSCRRYDDADPVPGGTTVNVHYMARAIRFADFDGDGDQDVFMTPSVGKDGTKGIFNHGCAPRMFMNDGDGTFAEVKLSTTMQSRLESKAFFSAPFTMDVRAMDIEVGDLDGDGLPDLVVAQSALRSDTVDGVGNGDDLFPDAVGGIEIYLNSAQRFGEPTLIPFPAGQEAAYNWYGNQVQLGDLDGDGALDILFAFVACGNAICVPPACTLVCGETVTGETRTDHRAIFWNNGSASFTLDEGALTPLGTALSNTITDALIFDMDNDGRMDIGFGTVGTNEFYRNLGNRKFEWVANSALTTELTPRRTPLTNGVSQYAQRDPGSTLAAGDYDQDGLMDLLVGRRNGGRTELFRGVGGGAFSRVPDATSSNAKLSSLEANDVAFADIDLDGDLDLLVTGYVANGLHSYDFIGFHSVYSFDRCAENYGAVPGVGTRACVLCPMISVGFGDVCMECPESRVRMATPETPSGECTLCTGSLTRLQGEQECTACPACPLGYYCDNEDSLGVDCGEEYYADGPKKCLEGFYGETEGQIASSCTGPCNSGHYCPAGSTKPAPESCMPQHFLMYDLSNTSNPEPLCQSCNGTLRSPTGQSSWYGSPSIAGEVHPYGKDGDLTGLTKCWNYTRLPTGVTLETLPLQDNHWRQFNWSLIILPCLKDGVCLGGDPVADVPFQCRAGHEGPFCAACSNNYYMQAGMCKECDGSSQLAFVPFYILLLLVALVIAFVIYKACAGSEADTGDLVERIGNFGASVTSDGATAVAAAVQDVTTEAAAAVRDVTIEAAIATAEVTQEKNRFARLYLHINKRGPQIMVKVKILIALYQVLNGIGLVFSIPYPSFYESSLAVIEGIVSIELPQVMPLACIYPWFDLYMLLLVKTIGPLVGIAGLCLLGALLDALTCCASESRKRIVKSLKQSSTDAIFFMLFLIYPSVSSTIFSVFVCEELPNGDSYLRLDFTIRCDDDDRPFWVFWAVISSIVYPLGIPLMYAYLLCYKYRPQLEVEKTAEIMKVYRNRLAEFAGKDARELMSMTGPLCEEDLANIAMGDNDSPSVQDLRNKLGPFETAFPEEAAAMPWHVDWDSRRDENVPLPSYVRKLISGYERRTYWFEIFECLRKVMLVGLPVFFTPGSTGQLTLGLLICFFTYGVYNHFAPFVESSDDILQTVCQVQIFFALLSSIILKVDPDQEDNANILTIMLFVPPFLGLYLETPLPEELQKLYDYARGRCKFPYHGKTERETEASARSAQVPAAGL